MNLPAACEGLRGYQRQQLADVAGSLRRGRRRLLVVLATGAGKTHEIAAVTACAQRLGLRVLILAPRTRLVRQIHERLLAFGVQHSVIAAQMRGMMDRFQAVQLASADTLHHRSMVDGRMPLPPADVVIFDEAHLSVAPSRLALLDQYPQAVRLGFTATPARKSGQSLAAGFEELVVGPSIAQLIDARMLVKPRIFNVPVATKRELKSLPKDSSADYAHDALGELMSRPRLVGDVVTNWLKIAAGKSTIVFACNKAHGEQLTQEFCRAGVAAELMTDADSEADREAAIGRLESGQTKILANCFLLSFGTDIPTVECIVLARPTRSVPLFLQMVGRGLRPASGKDSCIVIDHGRVVESLGLPHIDRAWSLDRTRNINVEARQQQATVAKAEQLPRTCPECKHLWLVSEDGDACRCGWKPAPKPRAVLVDDADLVEIGSFPVRAPQARSPEVLTFFQQVLGWNVTRKPEAWRDTPRKVRAAAWFRTREKFDLPEMLFPWEVWSLQPIDCTPAVAGWLKSRQIRYAKRRRSA
ncbi:MAG: DEAD/DEAH box helicase [Steroidobacteraceae bacterium]